MWQVAVGEAAAEMLTAATSLFPWRMARCRLGMCAFYDSQHMCLSTSAAE